MIVLRGAARSRRRLAGSCSRGSCRVTWCWKKQRLVGGLEVRLPPGCTVPRFRACAKRTNCMQILKEQQFIALIRTFNEKGNWRRKKKKVGGILEIKKDEE